MVQGVGGGDHSTMLVFPKRVTREEMKHYETKHLPLVLYTILDSSQGEEEFSFCAMF